MLQKLIDFIMSQESVETNKEALDLLKESFHYIKRQKHIIRLERLKNETIKMKEDGYISDKRGGYRQLGVYDG